MKMRNRVSFARLIKMVAHRWQWFLLSVVICLCAALLYIHYATPVYKFSGKLMIQESDNYRHRGSTKMLRYVSNLGDVKRTEGVDNEVEILWSSNLMRDVVMSLNLYTDYRVKEGRKKRQVYATQPVTVELDRFHLDSLDQIALSYNRQANDDKNEIALRTEAFINERMTRLSEELNLSDNSIIDIKQQGGLTSLADGARSIAQADRYGAELTEAQAQGMMLDYLGEYVSKPENKYEIIPSKMGISSAVSEKMISRYNEVVQERKRLLRSASEESPQVKTLTAEADQMSAAIQTALQQAKHSSVTEQRRLVSQYSSFSGKAYGTPAVEKALMDVGRQQKVRNRLFQMLLQRREENSIALSSTSNHGKLVDEPMIEGQVRPNLWKVFGIALGAGLCCPFAIFYLIGFFSYKIENRKDLEEMTERPIIAEVPLLGDSVKEKSGIVIRYGVNEPITEVFRQMRTNIHFMLKGVENTILFTSSTSGEGKSFCAANLAMSFALLGKRVILCGMDIRKPALAKLFALEDSGKGLSNLLRKEEVTEADVSNQIVPSGTDQNLDLLTAGPIPPNPAELLARDSFGQVMAILKKTYDYVILDTAPVGLVTDTQSIGRYTDMTVFVCRAAYTPGYAVAQLNQLSIENRLPNTCFILNGLS